MITRILVVDDEEIILHSLKAIFKRHEIEVETESNPLKAIARFQKEFYQIVLVDVLMPEMKGADVIRAIKQLNPLCNVVVMTAFSTMAHVVDCIEAGAQDYITKPFSDIELLVDVVRHCIDRVARWRHSFGLDLDVAVVEHRKSVSGLTELMRPQGKPVSQ